MILAFRSETYDDYEETVGRKIEEYAKKDMEERRFEEWTASGVGEGEIADISVVGDGGWGKRSLGHSYDSTTGKYLVCYTIAVTLFTFSFIKVKGTSMYYNLIDGSLTIQSQHLGLQT